MKSFIQYLIEKRSNPEKNPKLAPYEQLEQYRGHADGLYASYTAVDKIGINPQSGYNTPNGIYTYHLPFMFNNMEHNKRLSAVPFAGTQPNVWIIKPVVPVLVIQNYTDAQLENDIQKLLKAFSKVPHVEDTIDLAKERAKGSFAGSQIWNITRMLSKGNSNKWNHTLRVVLGYSVICDDGSGTIHPAEPHQAVFLSIKSFKVVDKIKNSNPYVAREDNEYFRQQAETFSNSVSELRQACEKFLKFEKLQDFKDLISKIDNAISNKRRAGFSIEKALGSKLWKRFKNAIMRYDNPYYIITLGLATEDDELIKEIASDTRLSLKIAMKMHGRFIAGETSIAKDKQSSLKYLNMLNGEAYSSILLGYNISEPLKRMAGYFVRDKDSVRAFYKKFGVGGLTGLYHRYADKETTALNDIFAEVKSKHPDHTKTLAEMIDTLTSGTNVDTVESALKNINNILDNNNNLSQKQFNIIIDAVVDNMEGLSGLKILTPLYSFLNKQDSYEISAPAALSIGINIIKAKRYDVGPRNPRSMLWSILNKFSEPAYLLQKIIEHFRGDKKYYGVLKVEMISYADEHLNQYEIEDVEQALSKLE